MKNKKKHTIKNLGVNSCRFILSGLFIFSGFVKAVDPVGSQYKIHDYLEAFGIFSWLPSYFSLVIAVILSSLEFIIGICLFFGIEKKKTTIAVLAFMLFMTPLTFYLALANPISDCGCFGDALILTNWQTFGKNIILLIFAIMVYTERRRIVCFISVKSQGWITLYTIPFVIILSIYCLLHLPILDFRPYKIGSNIRENISIPPDAKPSVYESIFILERDGQRKEFTLDNYPDSTWNFVDARNTLKEKGYEPRILDFSMTDLQSGEDITENVLSNESYTFLLVTHTIEEADDDNIDLINEIYDYCVEKGYDFYCLTSSVEEQIMLWQDKTGAEYPFCLMDNTTLKTMIRSNLGLMLIKNGTILNKWSNADIPNEYMLTDRLENIMLGEVKQGRRAESISIVVIGFVLPLLIISGIDNLVVRRRFEQKLLKNIGKLPRLTNFFNKR